MKLVIILEVPVLNLGLVYCDSCWLKARIKLVRAPEGQFLALAFLSSQDGKKRGSVSTSSHSLLRLARGKKTAPGNLFSVRRQTLSQARVL